MNAAILEKIGEPLKVIQVQVPELESGQLLVRILSTGICGAQLQELDGLKGDPRHCPHTLGHEGCGIVQNVGSEVNLDLIGKKVVIHWRKGEGAECDSMPCYYQIPGYKYIRSGRCTTFSEWTVVSENRVTPIPDDIDPEFGALLGCCLSTALATVENVAQIKPGESVLIVGAGGVGLAFILAAKLAGAHPIVATDSVLAKWKLAKSIGATRFFPAYTEFHWVDYSNHTDHSANGHRTHQDARYDVIIDTCGSLSRFELLAKDGRYIMVGQPRKDYQPEIDWLSMFYGDVGKQIKATQAGGFNPTRDIPRYINLYRSGALKDWEKIITHRLTLYSINDAISLMRQKEPIAVGRVMIGIPANAIL